MQAGLDPAKLAAAVAFAEQHESPWRRDLRAQLEAGNFEPPPDNEIIGRGDIRILPEAWVAESVAPCALNPRYGLFWCLNSDGSYQPAAPRDSFFASGAGGNVIWIGLTLSTLHG